MPTTALDDRLAPKIFKIIEKYGREVTFLLGSASYDPTTGSNTISVGASLQEYVRKVTPPEAYASKYVDGSLIKRDDTRVYLAAQGLGFEPVAGIQVDIDGVIFRIVNVVKHSTGYLVALFELQLRG